MKYLQNNQSGSTKIKIVVILVAISLTAVATTYFVGSIKKSPYASTGNTFVNALIADDGATTYSMLTARLKQQVGTQQDWAQNVSTSFAGGGAKAKLIQSIAVPNPEATYGKSATPQKLTYKFTFTNGELYDMYIIVLKDKNSWKIDEYNSSFAK